MKDKTTNPITKKTPPTKSVKNKIDPRMIFSFRDYPISEAAIERIIKELIDWFYANPQAKTMSAFYHSYGIHPFTYSRLLKRSDKLKQAHEAIMYFIGNRLWELAVDKRGDWAAIKHRLYRYAPEFQEDSDYHSELSRKGNQNENGNVQYIVVDINGKKLNE
jgi:hypothetical protein